MEATAVREQDGAESKLTAHKQYLLCDENGLFSAALNDWEAAELKVESQCKSFTFWYRNPDRPSQDSLGVAYEDGEDIKIVRSDFLFFAQLPDGAVVTNFVDPRGIHLADAMPKLQSLARYAESHPRAYRRIEGVAETGGKLRALDLTRTELRKVAARRPPLVQPRLLQEAGTIGGTDLDLRRGAAARQRERDFAAGGPEAPDAAEQRGKSGDFFAAGF